MRSHSASSLPSTPFASPSVTKALSSSGAATLQAAGIRRSLRPVDRVAVKVLQIRTSKHARVTRLFANRLENLHCLTVLRRIHLRRPDGFLKHRSEEHT